MEQVDEAEIGGRDGARVVVEQRQPRAEERRRRRVVLANVSLLCTLEEALASNEPCCGWVGERRVEQEAEIEGLEEGGGGVVRRRRFGCARARV